MGLTKKDENEDDFRPKKKNEDDLQFLEKRNPVDQKKMR